MGLITAGRRESMGLITAGRLAGMTIIVVTSLNVVEIMFGMISLTEMILTSSPEFGCVCTGPERGWCSSALRFLAHVAALFSLQLPLAALTEGFDALRGSHSRRSSACGSANHAIAGGGSV